MAPTAGAAPASLLAHKHAIQPSRNSCTICATLTKPLRLKRLPRVTTARPLSSPLFQDQESHTLQGLVLPHLLILEASIEKKSLTRACSLKTSLKVSDVTSIGGGVKPGSPIEGSSPLEVHSENLSKFCIACARMQICRNRKCHRQRRERGRVVRRLLRK